MINLSALTMGSAYINFEKKGHVYTLTAAMEETRPEYKRLLTLELRDFQKNDNFIGSLTLREINKMFAWSCKLHIEQEYRNRGLYNILAHARDNLARDMGFSSILTSVRGDNKEHQHRLREYGFKSEMISPNKEGNTIVLMSKRL